MQHIFGKVGKFFDFLISDMTRLNFCSTCLENNWKLLDNPPKVRQYTKLPEIVQKPEINRKLKIIRKPKITQNFHISEIVQKQKISFIHSFIMSWPFSSYPRNFQLPKLHENQKLLNILQKSKLPENLKKPEIARKSEFVWKQEIVRNFLKTRNCLKLLISRNFPKTQNCQKLRESLKLTEIIWK